MSEGYWKGTSDFGTDAPGAAAQPPASAAPVRGSAPAPAADAAGTPPTAGGYWQGSYRVPDPDDPQRDYHAPGHGSMTSSARQAYADEALRSKDHVAAGLLAIFLGVFGVHKFYLGCNQAGFIMLAVSIIGGIFTFGLAAAVIEVIAIIEGVIYLTRSQTDFDRIYVLCQRDWF